VKVYTTAALEDPRAARRARLDGMADGVSLTHNRAPDPGHWADVVSALQGRT
jgi:hypothetical protein